MNERYVDNINIAVQATASGPRYKNNKTSIDDRAVVENETISVDERNMMIIKQIRNDIHSSI
jgi:hypothetical protein